MSLLDSGANYEPCTVYPEVVGSDRDGNTITKASDTGIPATARFQLKSQSGTSSRRAEQNNEGFESEQVYSMRFPRSWTAEHGILGAQAQVEWGLDSLGRPQRWEVFGDAARFNNSRKTAHVVYTIKRA